ncbi:DUF2461 domain-containing protein [Flavobacteriaceae bacterium F08102]|nr:DUF2461 domain-containing protein [Flavobacteriaceae bacterium F08102]
MIPSISKSTLIFLKELTENNNREWFLLNKKRFKELELEMKIFNQALFNDLQKYDEVDKLKMFRIHRDVRFSKDKTPYKQHFGCSFHRKKPALRGGYYIQIAPQNSFLAVGFWNPSKEDLLRIRKELALDASELRSIINEEKFNSVWGGLKGDEVKTAPKGFDKGHSDMDLIKKKQFIFTTSFNDKEVLSANFFENVVDAFSKARPYFDYMSEVLTTDLNGVSLIEE